MLERLSLIAQYIPTWFVVAALSPLIVIVFAIILGFLSRSWKVGAVHTGLVLIWVALFALAARYVENDYIIWTPLALYALHALSILVLIAVKVTRRISTAGRAG